MILLAVETSEGWNEDELSRELLREEIFLCFRNVRQRIGLGNDRADLTALDVGNKILEDHVFLEGTAEEGKVFQVERAYIQLRHRPGYGTGHRVATAPAHDLQQFRPLRPGDEINNHIDRIASEMPDKVLPAWNDMVCAK